MERIVERVGTHVSSAAGVVLFVFLLYAASPISLPAQTLTTLQSFDGTDGYSPEASPIQATDGNFYGTTQVGGANANCTFYSIATGCGTVFRITPSGVLTTLYSFCSKSGCTDGAYPYGGLVQGTSGDLYGTTAGGGANVSSYSGTIFKITLSGTLTTLYTFCSQSGCTDGEAPYGGLVQATNGAFYGLTGGGGAHGAGTIFKITPAGTLTTLYSFCALSGCADGQNPSFGSLVQATNGDLYGTTNAGGANGDGTVFKITPAGTLTTLHSFDGTDGKNPDSTLVQATNGNLYGTTYYGGANNLPYGYGTVFKITPSGTLTTLHSFDDTDGIWPTAGLVQGSDGNLYGATQLGGANGVGGTIFRITPSGTLTTLYSFCAQSDCTDGYGPLAAPVQGTNGSFYGTTWLGGSYSTCRGCAPGSSESPGYGTIFSLAVGLGPFVETQPTSGKVGTAVRILGTDLKGSTSVTFNGTAAGFKVVSNAEITTTVPTGAKTGTVKVVTPSGTLSSNVAFRVP